MAASGTTDRKAQSGGAGRRLRRSLGVGVIAVVAMTLLTVAPVHAASNDDRANATVVTEPLPFTDSVDTTGATGESDDPGCISTPGDPGNPTVWYRYTPPTDGFVQANSFGSNYDTTIGAYVDEGGGVLRELACNDDAGSLQSRVDVPAIAGEPILFMVGAFAGTPGGGQLTFTVDAGAPPLEASLSLDPTAKVVPSRGEVTVSGTADCSRSASAEIYVTVVQQRAGAVVQADGYGFFPCDGATSWQFELEPSQGRFAAGTAQVMAGGYAFDASDFVSFEPVSSTVKLKGSRPGPASQIDVTSDIQYGEADGQALLLDLYELRRGPGRNRPVVIYAHGGSFVGGSRTSPQAVSYATDFAEAGFVSASMSYRLNGPGAVADAQHDMQAAVRWFRSNARSLGVDPDRIYVMGHSAGAITALFTNFNSEDPGSSGNPDVASDVAGAISLAGLVNPAVIDPGEPPILLYHGTNDGVAPIGGARVTCNVTIAAGNSCDLVEFEGVGHSLEAFHDEIVAGTAAFVEASG